MPVATIEEAVVQKLRLLPQEKQQQALEFVEALEINAGEVKSPRRSLKGALAHLNIQLSSEDIAEARREMWRGYMQEGAE